MILQLKHGKYCEMKIIVMNHTIMNNPIEIGFLKKKVVTLITTCLTTRPNYKFAVLSH